MSNPTMQHVRTIVAATDLSPASDIAVEQAALLAKQSGVELVLLHVFNDGFWLNDQGHLRSGTSGGYRAGTGGT